MPRKSLLYFLILSVGAIFIGRLFFLQVVDSKYRQNPLNNSAVTVKFAYPDRGFIYDRNGKLLVANQSSYDIMIIPKDVEPLDTLEFCNLLKITKEDFLKRYHKTRNYSPGSHRYLSDNCQKKIMPFYRKKCINTRASLFRRGF